MGRGLSQEEVIRLAVQEGVKAANAHMKEEYNKLLREHHRKKLHNTRLLIKNYRAFKAHSLRAVYSAAECEDSIFDILSIMTESNFAKAETTVNSIKNSAARTAVMVKHIETMVETYKIWCERSGKEDNMRHYRVIYALYIADECKSIDEIAEMEFVDRSTIYRDIKEAIEMLASLIFGIDSLKE